MNNEYLHVIRGEKFEKEKFVEKNKTLLPYGMCGVVQQNFLKVLETFERTEENKLQRCHGLCSQ